MRHLREVRLARKRASRVNYGKIQQDNMKNLVGETQQKHMKEVQLTDETTKNAYVHGSGFLS